jgi:hypothetical protein
VFVGREPFRLDILSSIDGVSFVSAWKGRLRGQRVILDCLAKNPDERPQSAESLTAALEACVDANRWTTAHAERFWRETAETTPPAHDSSARDPESGEQLKRTISPADLDTRIESKRTA